MLTPDQRRVKIHALLDQLPASPGGKELLPAFTGLLDTVIATTAPRHHAGGSAPPLRPLDLRMPDFDEAREELVKAAAAIDRLGFIARYALTFGPDLRDPGRMARAFRDAACEVERLRSEHVEEHRARQDQG